MKYKQKIRIFRRNVRAVSPVIATIILVAISIVMAIAVAYWALGIGNSFTKFEKIQYTSTTYALPTETGWTVYMDVKNTGTATATITSINLNGLPISAYPAEGQPVATFTATIAPGDSQTVSVTLSSTEAGINGAAHSWVSGMTVGVDVNTAAGNSYPTTVLLP
jgi:FlaG/FlaF family flagellin (archaellin)